MWGEPFRLADQPSPKVQKEQEERGKEEGQDALHFYIYKLPINRPCGRYVSDPLIGSFWNVRVGAPFRLAGQQSPKVHFAFKSLLKSC